MPVDNTKPFFTLFTGELGLSAEHSVILSGNVVDGHQVQVVELVASTVGI